MKRVTHRNDYYTHPGIQTYMSQVYGWMAMGLLLTAFVAWYAVHGSNITMYLMLHQELFIGLLIAKLALVIGLITLLPKLNSALATTMFMLYSAMTGLTTSIVLFLYTDASVAKTFFITAAMFSSLSAYGYTTKHSLNGMGNFLFMALIGLLITSLSNFWLKDSGLQLLISYAGVVIFSILTAYDTQKLQKMGRKINHSNQDAIRKYAIFGALTLYVDLVNLFWDLLHIIGKRRPNK